MDCGVAREAEQIEQFELPVTDDELSNWVRQGQKAAAVISSRETLPESLIPVLSGTVRLCRCKTVLCVRRIVR